MSTTIQPASASEDWQIAESGARPAALVVQLRRSAYVLPWFRFVYAEGDDATIQIAFASHVIIIAGHGLEALLADVSMQRLVRVVQPTENEAKFNVRGPGAVPQHGAGITAIAVEPADSDPAD